MFGEATAPSDNSVFLRPFKLFICYEEALRELLTNIRNRLEYPMYGPVPKPASNSSKASLNEAVDAETPYEENPEGNGVYEDQGTSNSSVHPPNSDPGAALEVSHAMAEHLDAMLRFTDVELKQYRAIFRRLRSREAETVDFKDLWFLFAPGDKIYHSETKQAYQVLAVSGGRSLLTKNLEDLESDEPAFPWSSPTAETEITSPFVIDCIYLDFNGEELGPANHQVTIMPYTGSQAISSLEFLPLEYARTVIDTVENTELPVEDYLVKRGKRYLDLLDSQEVPHREYIGFSVGENREQIDSRVIIDLSLYWEKNIEKRPVLGLRRPEEADVREVAEMNTCSCYNCRSESKRRNSHIYDDRKVDRQRMEAFIAENSDTWRLIRDPKGKVKHDLLCLLPSRVFGYVLRSRKWHQLDMDRTSPVKQRAQNFNDLILPTDYKDLVEGMVRTHARGSKPSISMSNDASAIHGTDLVRGKGKGVIILLHGVPGVGKTSTAECVAEYTLRPLFSITCGDIGEDAKTVEANLEENFQLAHRWGCVLLLDEADVFLQTRNKSDMARNAVVSVFLRILEYYSGILFLTTNKVGTFDDAFTSRIHLSLYYPPLDRKQTKKIWKVNLDRIQRTNQDTLVVQKEEIMQWVKELMEELRSRDFRPWNGRQIHNACQTATSIAKFRPKEHGVLGPGEFETVKNATFDFDDYLKNVHGMDDAGRAKRNFDRNDFWGDEPYYGGASTKQRPSSYGRRRNLDYGDQGRGKGRKRNSRDDRKRYDGDSGSDEVRERRKSRKEKDSDSDSDSDSSV
ncbi:AAA family ATPase [Lasiodiplodia theobromae]|uniref:AAA family ATPase n=1 Tax=Lasiodiplodia theobromae TaxID=45133 RepID=UPI0015C303C6|nr:AAA family ATPase [Lasiodiplodia theobromae]KAF4545365.1 AAA family ATPase [Lasiodiplodia theobromae]